VEKSRSEFLGNGEYVWMWKHIPYSTLYLGIPNCLGIYLNHKYDRLPTFRNFYENLHFLKNVFYEFQISEVKLQ
jgi:hypothetical protein